MSKIKVKVVGDRQIEIVDPDVPATYVLTGKGDDFFVEKIVPADAEPKQSTPKKGIVDRLFDAEEEGDGE
jgi:hypothetical protein